MHMQVSVSAASREGGMFLNSFLSNFVVLEEESVDVQWTLSFVILNVRV